MCIGKKNSSYYKTYTSSICDRTSSITKKSPRFWIPDKMILAIIIYCQYYFIVFYRKLSCHERQQHACIVFYWSYFFSLHHPLVLHHVCNSRIYIFIFSQQYSPCIAEERYKSQQTLASVVSQTFIETKKKKKTKRLQLTCIRVVHIDTFRSGVHTYTAELLLTCILRCQSPTSKERNPRWFTFNSIFRCYGLIDFRS